MGSDERSTWEKILKCLRLAESSNDHEALHAWRSALRLMKSAEIEWRETLVLKLAEPHDMTNGSANTAATAPEYEANESTGTPEDFEESVAPGSSAGAGNRSATARGKPGVRWSAVAMRHPIAENLLDMSWVEDTFFAAPGFTEPSEVDENWRLVREFLDSLSRSIDSPLTDKNRVKTWFKTMKREGQLALTQMRQLVQLCQSCAY